MPVIMPDLTAVSHGDHPVSCDRVELIDTSAHPAFKRLSAMAKRLLNVTAVEFTLLPQKQSLFHVISFLVPSPSPCHVIVESGNPVMIVDRQQSAWSAQSTDGPYGTFTAYLGVPLKGSNGSILGSVCALDQRPHHWSDVDVATLNDVAALAATEIELQFSRQEVYLAHRAETTANRLLTKVDDASPKVISVVDLETQQTVYLNKGISLMLGYPEEAVGAEGVGFLQNLVHPEDRQRILTYWEQVRTLADNEIRDIEYRAAHASGEWRWVRCRCILFNRYADGRPTEILSILDDITERRNADDALRSISNRLRHSNQTLQDFASVASHDLQEPLRKILQFGSHLQTRQTDALAPEARDYLERMLRAADRMQGLLGDLLTYSRVSSRTQPFRPVDLNDLVNGLIHELQMQRRRPGRIQIVSDLPIIEGDQAQLRQLFSHLLDNALKFRQEDVPLEVRIHAEHCFLWGADYSKITVEDNGIGFEPRYAERIFEVFERLHERDRYPGTGIGLAICRRIVERHGGTIQASGIPLEGATFTILVPLKQFQIPELRKDDTLERSILLPIARDNL